MTTSVYVTATFWQQAAERAVKTFAQTAIATIGVDSLDIISADWGGIASLAAGGAVLSLLSSVASARIGGDESPSLV